MYASQTKRLCVRGAPSDETTTRVVQPNHSATTSSSSGVSQSTTSELVNQQQLPVSSKNSHQKQQSYCSDNILSESSGNKNMTASATGTLTEASGANGHSENESITRPLANAIPSLNRRNQHQCNITTAYYQREESAEHELINKLANEVTEENKVDLLISIRNLITACNKKKDSIVRNPSFSKIINLIDEDKDKYNKNDKNLCNSQVKTQLALLLCSVAKSGEHTVNLLNESYVDERIYKLILNSDHNDETLTEACLRCLRSIMSWPSSRTWLMYENHQQRLENQYNSSNLSPTRKITSHDAEDNYNNLQKIIAYARNSNSLIIQECIADIFASTCVRSKDQALLLKASAIPCIVQLLESPSTRVIIASLYWLTGMCLKNHLISLEVVNTRCPSNKPVLDHLTTLMMKEECLELQFLSARCFAHIYRALATEHLKDDPRIINHVLPTLTRMVHKDKPAHLRIKSAECIAYLIEGETRLQSAASICDHLIDSLADMLEYEHNSVLLVLKNCSETTQYRCSRIQDRGVSWLSITSSHMPQQHSPAPISEAKPSLIGSAKTVSHESATENSTISELNLEMKRASFLALAALASNLEPIRKKIFNTCTVMQHLVKSLTDSDTKTLKSVLTCLLSLSRSVQQLRTSFAENSVYNALKNLLTTASNEVLILVLAILCNISLDFSPGKQHFLDSKTIDILCNLTKESDPTLKLHGMWILMNMVYQLKDQNLKFQILRSIGVTHLLSLLETEDDDEIVLKTLGFLRNLLSQKLHIDFIMKNHGDQIMPALFKLLEKPCSNRIKEQNLCVLTNIADGIESKAFIMNNKNVLAYLARAISDEQAGELRLASICCITNLAHKEYERSHERRNEMKKLGIDDKLKSMLNTSDPILSDRVRTAYNQFLIGVEDKYVN